MDLSALERVKEFYETFDGTDLKVIDELYHQDAVFVDPLVRLEGVSEIRRYFGKVYGIADFVSFTLNRTYQVDSTVILFWTMQFSNRKLARGERISLDGVSECRFEGDKLVSHVDFYDTAQMVYYHVPVIGSVLGALKRRLH